MSFNPNASRAGQRAKYRRRFRPALSRCEERIAPAVFTVTDSGDTGLSTQLRQILTVANSNGQPDTINFNLPAASTISITNSTSLSIAQDVTINGPGADKLAIDMNYFGRHFTMTATGLNVTISGLTLKNGYEQFGAGIFVEQGCTLTLEKSVITGCFAYRNGGAICMQPYGLPSTAKVIVSNSTLSQNLASVYGGALFFTAGVNLSISNSTLSANTSAKNDGGGGAIGGYFTSLGSINIRNTTITGNSAKRGGAIFVSPYPSSAGVLSIESTIISGNLANNEPGLYGPFYAAWMSSKTSVIQSMLGTFNNLGGNLALGTDPLLDVLANNGSAMKTHALKAGSPALNVGSNPDSLGFDQRGLGYVRTANGGIDMGAFEVPPPAPPPPTALVSFGDGSQRSLVKQIVVTFSESVTFSGAVASAFSLYRHGSGLPTDTVGLTANPSSGTANSVTISFSGGMTENGSLRDGYYDLLISAAQVSGVGGALDGNHDGVAGGSYSVIGNSTNKLFRLFGDANGDASTTDADFSVFRTAFNLVAHAMFDFDNDGNVGLKDFAQFRSRISQSP